MPRPTPAVPHSWDLTALDVQRVMAARNANARHELFKRGCGDVNLALPLAYDRKGR